RLAQLIISEPVEIERLRLPCLRIGVPITPLFVVAHTGLARNRPRIYEHFDIEIEPGPHPDEPQGINTGRQQARRTLHATSQTLQRQRYRLEFRFGPLATWMFRRRKTRVNES